MRISDWSSDVCSADRIGFAGFVPAHTFPRLKNILPNIINTSVLEPQWSLRPCLPHLQGDMRSILFFPAVPGLHCWPCSLDCYGAWPFSTWTATLYPASARWVVPGSSCCRQAPV